MSQRTTEIGVRMALGATRRRVLVMVLRQIAVLMVTGLAVGGVASYFAARAVHSFLYEIEADDPRVFAVAAGVLVAIGLIAAGIPGWRAMHVEPMQALRNE